MTSTRAFEKISASIVSMNKSQLKKRIKTFKGNFKLDFTDTYLDGLNEDKLRHILMAAAMTKR